MAELYIFNIAWSDVDNDGFGADVCVSAGAVVPVVGRGVVAGADCIAFTIFEIPPTTL